MSWLLAAVLAAAMAAALAVPGSLDRRLAERPPARLPGWLQPRPGGLSTRQRGLAAVAAAASMATWTGHLGWLAALATPAVASLVFLALGRVGHSDRGRRRRDVVAAVPEACDLLAAAVDAGLPVRLAVPVVAPAIGGPVGEALATVAARVELGMPESNSWSELAEPGMEPLARELARTVTTGVGLGRLLRDLAVEARRSAAAEAMVRARRVGVHSVLPVIACFLPSFLLLGVVPLLGGIIAAALR